MNFNSKEEWLKESSRRITAARLKKFKTSAEAADALRRAQSNINMWESGFRFPNLFELPKVAAVYEVAPSYLAGWTSDVIFPASLSGVDENLISLPRWFVEAGARPSKLRTAIMDDSSMAGQIIKGAIVIIDVSEIPLRDDIFAMRRGGTTKIRHVRVCPDGSLIIKPNNPMPGFEEEVIAITDRPDFEKSIIGRVATWINPI